MRTTGIAIPQQPIPPQWSLDQIKATLQQWTAAQRNEALLRAAFFGFDIWNRFSERQPLPLELKNVRSQVPVVRELLEKLRAGETIDPTPLFRLERTVRASIFDMQEMDRWVFRLPITAAQIVEGATVLVRTALNTNAEAVLSTPDLQLLATGLWLMGKALMVLHYDGITPATEQTFHRVWLEAGEGKKPVAVTDTERDLEQLTAAGRYHAYMRAARMLLGMWERFEVLDPDLALLMLPPDTVEAILKVAPRSGDESLNPFIYTAMRTMNSAWAYWVPLFEDGTHPAHPENAETAETALQAAVVGTSLLSMAAGAEQQRTPLGVAAAMLSGAAVIAKRAMAAGIGSYTEQEFRDAWLKAGTARTTGGPAVAFGGLTDRDLLWMGVLYRGGWTTADVLNEHGGQAARMDETGLVKTGRWTSGNGTRRVWKLNHQGVVQYEEAMKQRSRPLGVRHPSYDTFG